MSETKDNNLGNLIAGIIIGAAVTYLFTTKNGRKIKDRLLIEGEKLLEDLSEIAAESEIGEELENKKEEVLEKVEETVSEVPEHIEQIQKKGRRFFFRRGHASHES